MNWKVIVAGLLYAISFAILMLHCHQNEFQQIFIHFSFCFLSFGFLVYNRKEISLKWLIGFGIVLRLFTVFVFPNLSDDIYRFFWDGRLWTLGIHPFDFTPSQLMENGSSLDGLKEVFPLLNSKEYYTIYPPVLQFVFIVSASLGKTVAGTAIVMKLLYVLMDILAVLGLTKLLDHFKMDRSLSMLYFLNPLIVTELVGNIHAEVLMVCSLIWMAYLICKEKYWKAGILYGLSIACKILPFLIGPLLLLYLIKNKGALGFFSTATIVVLLSFTLMLVGSDISHLLDSIDLYFRSFEFNAGLYYIGRWLGYAKSGYNMIGFIGPLLAIISVALILFNSFKVLQKPEAKFLLASIPLLYLIYLLFSTTIHPWYLAVPIAFAVFNERYLFPIILWSFLVMLSYSAYDTVPVQEHTIFLLLEYGILFVVLIYGSVKNPIRLPRL